MLVALARWMHPVTITCLADAAPPAGTIATRPPVPGGAWNRTPSESPTETRRLSTAANGAGTAGVTSNVETTPRWSVGHGFTDETATRHMHDEFARATIDARHVLADPPDDVATVTAAVLARVADGSLLLAPADQAR